MRILGIDPGLRKTGYGVIDAKRGKMSYIEAGIIETQSKNSIASRVKTIHREVRQLMDELKPNVLVLEKIFAHYRHPTTALLMGHVRGVICLASGEENVPLVNIPSTRVKKSVISKGHASKGQIQRAVQFHLGLNQAPRSKDASDALAMAISYALTRRNGQ